MTGFARCDGSLGSTSWHWEIKSVNGRGLDVRLRLPPGSDRLEPKIREALQKRIVRGSVNVSLQVAEERRQTVVRVNESVLRQVVDAALTLSRELGGAPPKAEALLALPGVIDTVEEPEDEAEAETRSKRMLSDFETALDRFTASRAEEGGRLQAVLEAQIAEIERLVGLAETSPQRSVAAIQARIAEQVRRLMETGQAFDPMRLHQEAVMIATRVDVEEEIKRLKAHVAAARDILRDAGAVGRKLDFLAQEFNREANTLTSKANDEDIARAGLALKAVIDQLREQVQNIE